MNRENNLVVVMKNVMAALGASGVDYDVNNKYNVGSFEAPLEEIQTNRYGGVAEVVPFEDAAVFSAKLREYAEMENHGHVSAHCWADDGDYVVVQLKRLYVMTDEDWAEYAAYCGCEDGFEAQAIYGDPAPSYTYMNVRVKKRNLSSFVGKVAPYCWGTQLEQVRV